MHMFGVQKAKTRQGQHQAFDVLTVITHPYTHLPCMHIFSQRFFEFGLKQESNQAAHSYYGVLDYKVLWVLRV